MNEPKIVNACNQSITTYLARVALLGTGRKPTMVLLHPDQMMMVCELFETMTLAKTSPDVEEALDKVKALLEKFPPVTFMGIEIKQDPTMPNSWIEFHDAYGLIARIENLAVPLVARADG